MICEENKAREKQCPWKNPSRQLAGCLGAQCMAWRYVCDGSDMGGCHFIDGDEITAENKSRIPGFAYPYTQVGE